MKFLLKFLLAPIRLVIWLSVRLFALVTYLSSFALGMAGALLGALAVIVLLTTSVKNGLFLLALAYLISPLGLPMLAVKVIGVLDRFGGALADLTCS